MQRQISPRVEQRTSRFIDDFQGFFLLFVKRSLMDDHGMIVVGLPAFERITEDGHLAGSGLLNDQQAGQECDWER